jgi:dTDP-4-amino-4,6-dideoxygalactose transaminase
VLPKTPAAAEPAWHLFVVAHPQADAVIAALSQRGIGARGYYRIPVHRQPALAGYLSDPPSLPVTDELAATNFALPMGPALDRGDVETVVSEVERAASALEAR